MAMASRPRDHAWTLEEFHELPDDGNKYELVRGEVFMTPPPSDEHDEIIAWLYEIMVPYVIAHKLGRIFPPTSVVRVVAEEQKSEVQPDLMVRQPSHGIGNRWELAPVPILVAEVLSPRRRKREFGVKRKLYMDVGVAEYWIIDREERCVHVITRDGERVVTDEMAWLPAGAGAALSFALSEMFGERRSP